MPILSESDYNSEELWPGVDRKGIVGGDLGAESTSVADLTMSPESTVPTHIHPTEEAMVILEGELDAVLGDEVVPVTVGQTVFAPPGVKHGFTNRSGAPARLMAIFPTARPERTYVD